MSTSKEQEQWVGKWLKAVVSGENTISQRKLTSIEKKRAAWRRLRRPQKVWVFISCSSKMIKATKLWQPVQYRSK
jgi:hypothetical protein